VDAVTDLPVSSAAGLSGRVGGLPADAIEAAQVPNQVRPSDVLIVGARVTDDVIELIRAVEQADARAALAAALPFLERAIRDKIADEIMQTRDGSRYRGLNRYAAITEAARVARGGEATQ
jgi:hypothetical protein